MIRRATRCLLVSSFYLVVVSTARGADPVEPASADKSSQAEASCLLKITFDPQTLPFDAQSITYLFTSSGIAGVPEGSDASAPQIEFQPMNTSKAGPSPLTPKLFKSGSSSSAIPKAASSEFRAGSVGGGSGGGGSPFGSDPFRTYSSLIERANQSPGEQDLTILGRLTVRSGDAKKSHELMKAITKRFQATLENAQKSDLDRLNGSVQVAARQADEALMRIKMLQEKRQALLALSEFNDLSRDSLLEISRKLESERQETSVRLETRKARNEAIRRRLSENATSQQAEASMQDYRRRVFELENSVMELSKKYGDGAPRVKEARESIAQAKAALQMKVAEVAQAASSKFLDSLSDQLGDNSVDLVESEARLKLLQHKCMEMRDLLARADDYEIQVGLELPLAKMGYESARQRQEELRRRVSSIQPPSVIVLGE